MSSSIADPFSPLAPARHSGWEPRRATTLEEARKRTRYIRWLRIVLIGLALGVSGGVIAQLVINSLGETPQEIVTVGEDARMINPRFTGRDEAGTPYVVTAEAAIRRRGEDVQITELERPQLDYDLLEADAEAEGVLAQAGRFDADARTLDLLQDVRFRTRSGYEFQAQHARIHLSEERVVGESPVNGAGPLGRISADTYEILDGGERVVFTGNVQTHLYNEARSSGDAE